MNKESLKFLERLCNSFGPSGFEREPLKLTKEYIRKYSDEIVHDKLGSLLFKKIGTSKSPIVLLPGHVDEVGFIVSGINDKGYLTFNTVGGWFDQVLLGQRVLIRTKKGDVLGIIAAKPPHLLPLEERKKVVVKEKMFIDVGCSNKEEAENLGIRIGDPVAPVSDFSSTQKVVFEEKKKRGKMTLAIGKAFDDRIGAFIAAEVVKRLSMKNIEHPNTLIGAATTQEEVGLRGAKTTAHLAEPDVCITLEVDIAGDVPGIEPHEAPAKMGKGPAMLTFDRTMIPNQPLKEFIIDIAEKNKIPLQLSHVRGGTDAGVIHIHGAGCPSVVIGIPTRHIHSHVGILSLDDVENGVRLIIEVIKKLDQKTVNKFTAI
jgi:putative aminopeptidase FrvX